MDRLRVGLVLAAYPAAQLLFRLIATEGLEWDEAEQLVLSQDLALGYPAVAAQPPLYTWLQIGLFAVLGVNVLAVAGLRAILQIVTQLALYRSAHLVLGDRGLAVLAALSLWLVPQFSVESLAKTHSVLVTCLGALLVHALLRLGPRRRARDYAWLGAVLGLGALAKYNFPLVAAALLLGAATVPALRPALADRRLALALGVAVLLAAPHVAWVAGHLAQAGAHIGEKVRVETAWSFLRAGRGVLGLVWDLLAYLPPLLVALWVFGRPRSPVSPAAAAAARLIERFWLLAFVALVAAVFAFALPRFKEHWLQPFAFLLPLYLFCRAPAGAPPASGRGRYAAVLAAALVLLVGWRFVEAWVGHHVGASTRLNDPYPALARQLAARGVGDGVIVTDHHLIGGNLRFAFPRARVLTVRMAETGAATPPGPCLVVWDARRTADVPPALAPWAPAGAAVDYVEATAPRAERTFRRLGVIRRPACGP